MAHYDLEEQEQLDTLKTWWKMYGNLVTTVVTVFCLRCHCLAGLELVSARPVDPGFGHLCVLEQAVAARDAQKIKAAAGELAEKFGSTSTTRLSVHCWRPSSLLKRRSENCQAQLVLGGRQWQG
jgi:predicted negative regulator of RcsB-dependent stress response